jgi:CRP/FNR family transcriptional regulator, cyclic AMP receptor protein
MTPVAAAKKHRRFNLQTFLSTIDGGRKKLSLPKKQMVFSQGDSADSVFYIQKGKVKLSVVAKGGKEATIGILNEGSFFGEGCLAGQPSSDVLRNRNDRLHAMRIDKKSMMEVLHREHAFSDMFVAYLLTRNIRYEEDLVDQLFNSSEKRLARILLLLAHFGKDGKPEVAIPKISQESLAEMVGCASIWTTACGQPEYRVPYWRWEAWQDRVLVLSRQARLELGESVWTLPDVLKPPSWPPPHVLAVQFRAPLGR